MTLFTRLARCAGRVLRYPAPNKRAPEDIQASKRRVYVQLRTSLPPHILKDIGADDG